MPNAETLSKSDRIRMLNDSFRSTFVGGVVLVTQGVDMLSPDVKAEVLRRVRSFSQFNSENDPRNEHDFGNFEIAAQTFFFKVDYYARDMEGGSEDPAEPAKTTRVLTIMRADEY